MDMTINKLKEVLKKIDEYFPTNSGCLSMEIAVECLEEFIIKEIAICERIKKECE